MKRENQAFTEKNIPWGEKRAPPVYSGMWKRRWAKGSNLKSGVLQQRGKQTAVNGCRWSNHNSSASWFAVPDMGVIWTSHCLCDTIPDLCWFRSGNVSLEERSWGQGSFPAPHKVQRVSLLTTEGDPSASVVWRGKQTAEGKQSARKNSWLESAALNLPMNTGCELQNDTLAPGKQNGYKAPIQLGFNGREDRSALWEKSQLLISILSGDGAQYSSFLPAKSGGSTMCFKVITAAHPRSGCISNEAGDAQVGSGCSWLNVEPAFRPGDEKVLSKTNHHICFRYLSNLPPSGLPNPAAPPWMAGKPTAARPNVAPVGRTCHPTGI